MKKRENRIAAGARGLLACAAVLLAPLAAADYSRHPLAGPFVETMVQQHGFERAEVEQLLTRAQRQQAILDAISRPAEKAKPWKEYRRIFITPDRIEQGVQFWRENAEVLARAERELGVPAEVIVGIIGVETRYGRNTGSYRVLDALATLGFDYPPRADFFRKQLEEFLVLARERQLPLESLKGSYAGAMGFGQFIPSSYRSFAIDFNGDGRIDILNDIDDAIGSVANYLKVHGWQPQGLAALPASVRAPEKVSFTTGLRPDTTVAQLAALGVKPQRGVPGATPVGLLRLEGDDGDEYWLGGPNFYVVTTYNRSPMYALAVLQLSEAVAAQWQR
jgi:membrane-bound lytic murein transglycosylase B